MSRFKLFQSKKPVPSPAPAVASVAKPVRPETAFVPSPDEVARRAYFTYVNQGSANGSDVQHWLAAEAELAAERALTRTHGFHNQN
jgi:hypothetical protein